MIAKVEMTQNTAKQNKYLTLNPHKQWEQEQTMNKQQQKHRLRQQWMPLGDLGSAVAECLT